MGCGGFGTGVGTGVVGSGFGVGFGVVLVGCLVIGSSKSMSLGCTGQS